MPPIATTPAYVTSRSCMLCYYCLSNRGVDHGGVGGPDPPENM